MIKPGTNYIFTLDPQQWVNRPELFTGEFVPIKKVNYDGDDQFNIDKIDNNMQNFWYQAQEGQSKDKLKDFIKTNSKKVIHVTYDNGNVNNNILSIYRGTTSPNYGNYTHFIRKNKDDVNNVYDLFNTPDFAIDANKIDQTFNLFGDIKSPRWIYDDTDNSMGYYGSLASIHNKGGDASIYLSPDTILPFGLTNMIFKITLDDLGLADQKDKIKTAIKDKFKIGKNDSLKGLKIVKDFLGNDTSNLLTYMCKNTRANGKGKLDNFTITGGGMLAAIGPRCAKYYVESPPTPNGITFRQYSLYNTYGDGDSFHHLQPFYLGRNRDDEMHTGDNGDGADIAKCCKPVTNYTLLDIMNSVEWWILG